VLGIDGKLWVKDALVPSLLPWKDRGEPSDGGSRPTITQRKVGVLTVNNSPHLFVLGNDGPINPNDGNLWVNRWDGSEWHWENLQRPTSTDSQGNTVTINLSGLVGVLTVKDTTTSAERPHVFVLGNDGNLWEWDGSWHSHPKPSAVTDSASGAAFKDSIGVLTFMDSPTAPQRPYVFMLDYGANLWVRKWDGLEWQWEPRGKPGGVSSIVRSLGVLTFMDSPTAPQRDLAFVLGSDRNLWVNWLNGSRYEWVPQLSTTPATLSSGVTISNPIGVLTVQDATPPFAQRPYAFVLGSDRSLWVNRWDGSHWLWDNLQRPTSTDSQGNTVTINLSSPVGVLTVKDTTTSAERPHVFVLGNDGNLWVNS
jgi:hypothetical protein